MLTDKTDRTLIRKLARTNVEQSFANLSSSMIRLRWLPKSNRYAENTLARLKLDAKPTGSVRTTHLSQYISASSLLHCSDGWSYLGKAIDCLLRGDPHRVVHLAYYAELRAALSILASEGLGIFNDRHFALDGPKGIRKLATRRRTHEMAWECLEYWATLKRSGTLFSEIITPGGFALAEWFESLGGIDRYIAPQARAWFTQWSMDLSLFPEDRDARNESSYRPDGIPLAWYLTGAEALVLATEIWELCEPAPNSLFWNVDRQILRVALESAFKGATGKTPSENKVQFAEFISRVVDSLNLDAGAGTEWRRFLTRETFPNDPRVFQYAAENPSDKRLGHAAVLARASLLLRIASGSVLKLIRASGVSAQQLEFWWGKFGLCRGLWGDSKDRSELLDLWSDIAELVQDVRDFQTSTPDHEQTFHSIGTSLPHVVAGLGSCERVAIWSLLP